MVKVDNQILNKLFKSNYSQTTDDEFKQLDDIAHSILQNNTWDEVYENFDRYLKK